MSMFYWAGGQLVKSHFLIDWGSEFKGHQNLVRDRSLFMAGGGAESKVGGRRKYFEVNDRSLIIAFLPSL